MLQGENGLSRKSAVTASYYYSMPRLSTTGTVRVDNDDYHVNGYSWLDHEFSTSALASDQVGWDWFALHLDDGKDIMLYTIRRDDGTNDPYSSGSLVLRRSQPRSNCHLTSSASRQSVRGKVRVRALSTHPVGS